MNSTDIVFYIPYVFIFVYSSERSCWFLLPTSCNAFEVKGVLDSFLAAAENLSLEHSNTKTHS